MVGKIFILVLLCAAASIEAFEHDEFGHIKVGKHKNAAAKRDGTTPVPEYQTFTQNRDHFDNQDKNTFQQRYAVNAEFWDGTGPVFLYFSPENFLDPSVLVEQGGYIFVQWAKEFRALLVAIEIRYYGESFPAENQLPPNMKWLSDQQILADAAVFRQYIAEQYNAHHNKWISFGGSYPGALSAWMRIKYPNLVYASVASSAIIYHTDGNPKYMEVVGNVLEQFGGSQCTDNIRSASQQLDNLTATEEGRAYLSEYFNTCEPMQPNDVWILKAIMAGSFMGVVQLYGLYDFLPSPARVCEILTNESNSAWVNYRNLFSVFVGDGCVDVASGPSDAAYNNATSNEAAVMYSRPYVYQLCYELGGLFQISDEALLFGDFQPRSRMYERCYARFGYNVTKDNFKWTNTQYGGRHPGGSRILFINGNFDPWYPMSVTHTPPGVEWDTLFINGTSHCADMFVPTSLSPPTLAPAQAVIKHQLGKWIRECTV